MLLHARRTSTKQPEAERAKDTNVASRTRARVAGATGIEAQISALRPGLTKPGAAINREDLTGSPGKEADSADVGDQAAIAALSGQIAELMRQIQALEENVKTATAQKRDLLEQAEALQQAISDKEAALGGLDPTNDADKKQIDAIKAEAAKLRSEVVAIFDRIDGIDSFVDEANKKIESLEGEIATLQNKLDALQ